MAVERTPSGSSLIDVLDRVLDKGIVIDAWVRVSIVGIDLVTIEARVVVASIDTYLEYSAAIGHSSPLPSEAHTPKRVKRGLRLQTRRLVTRAQPSYATDTDHRR